MVVLFITDQESESQRRKGTLPPSHREGGGSSQPEVSVLAQNAMEAAFSHLINKLSTFYSQTLETCK